MRQFEREQRYRAVRFSRFCTNIKCPVRLTLALMLLIAGMVSCGLAKIPFPGDDTYPELVMFWDCSTRLFIFILFLFATVALLILPPRQAAKVEAALVHIGLIDRYDLGPILVSCQQIGHSSANRLTFYCRGIARKMWEKRQPAIEDVLNVHYLEPPKYGKNRNFVVLVVAPGVESKRKESLFDDEL